MEYICLSYEEHDGHYDVHGKTDLEFVNLSTDSKPELNKINVYGASTEPREDLDAVSMYGQLVYLSKELTAEILPSETNIHVSTSFSIMVAIFCRIDVEICEKMRPFAMKLVELLFKLQVITGNPLLIDYEGINCIFLNKSGKPKVWFTETQQEIAVQEKLMLADNKYEQADSNEEAIIGLHRKLSEALIPETKELIFEQNATKYYELSLLVRGLCRICSCCINSEVIELGVEILRQFRDKGLLGIEVKKKEE